MKIFVDTCVWRCWLYLINDCHKEYDRDKARSFNKIYKTAIKTGCKITLFYNERILQELDKEDLNKLEINFESILKNRCISKISIPLSRADGTYKADGSLLAGGQVGGNLFKLLGLGHAEKLKNAAPPKKENNPAHTKPRKKEFDVEHLGSAIEFQADLFITVDHRSIINKLQCKIKEFPDDENIRKAWEICCTPTEALNRILEQNN